MSDCMAPGTEHAADMVSWERYITDAERVEFELPPAPPGDPYKRIILACEDHSIPETLRTSVHDAVCTAPPTCDCAISAP